MSSDQPTAPDARPTSRVVTIVATITLVAAILLLNVPGSTIVGAGDLHDSFDSPFYAVRVEHGWPLTFLWRKPAEWVIGPEEKHFREVQVWDIAVGVERFSVFALLIDLLAGCMLVPLGLAIFHWWRSRREHLWQVHLLDLLAGTAIVAAACGWIIWNQRSHAAEVAVVAELSATRVPHFLVWQRGGPCWLRQLLPGEGWEIFDRCAIVDVEGPDILRLRKLRHLNLVLIMDHATNGELGGLADLPELELLAFVDKKHMRVPSGLASRRLPPLQRVWWIGFWTDSPFNPKGLDGLPNLRSLEITGNFADDGVPVLTSLSSLRRLAVRSGRVSPAGATRLRNALPECDIVINTNLEGL